MAGVRGSRRRGEFRPGLVTGEPHPGEEESYGAGMALVAEWRELWDRRGEGTALEQAACRVRIMELEIAMLGEHGLTLPPETEPLHPSRRAVQLDWRLRELADLRAERRRLELLRPAEADAYLRAVEEVACAAPVGLANCDISSLRVWPGVPLLRPGQVKRDGSGLAA